MKLELLEALYKRSLGELYDGEQQLLRILPKIAKAVSTEELRILFEGHTRETEQQIQRLKQLLRTRGSDETLKSKAMSGLLAETKELLKQPPTNEELLDAALTSAGQKVEAFEITSYACAHNFARLLGFHGDLRPLEESFSEEEKMEERLSAIAESLRLEEIESETEIEPAHRA